MSNEGDRAAVFRTTKVRTKLKGDGSWLQRRGEPEAEAGAEEAVKPWLAEVRTGRLNGGPAETSPASSPTKPTAPAAKPEAERAPASGYLIRGIFTKLDDKPASSSTSNGISRTTQFVKKPSESYKKIALHTVRPSAEGQEGAEGQLSHEEQEKRTEAASSVLRKSAVRQRSYVFSAAKKYETKEKTAETSPPSSSPSFVAKRVEIIDDDESAPAPAPAPASSPPLSPSPAAPVASVASAPQPKPRKIALPVPVAEPAAPRVEEKKEAAEEPAGEAPPRGDPFEGLKPGCTKVATPLPELVPVCVEAVCAEPEPAGAEPEPAGAEPEPEPEVSGQDDPPLVDLTPTASPAAPESAAPASAVVTAKTHPEPVEEPAPEPVEEPAPEPEEEPAPEPEPEPKSELSPKPSASVDTLTALYDTLISPDASPTRYWGGGKGGSAEDGEPGPAGEEGRPADSRAAANGVEKEPAPALGNCEPITEDLLALDDGPQESAEPVPPSPGRWSQDLLGGLDSEAEPAKTSGTLDLLADDIIPISTEEHSLSAQREEGKQTDEAAKETQSPTETVTVTTKTVIIADKSSADPFDPYPIGTTSPNSSPDLLQPLADISINSAPAASAENKDPSSEINTSGNALKSLADDVIPIDTDTTSLSTQRSWTRTWETGAPQQTNTEESREPEPGGQAEDQQTLIMFERKSTENDSPWDRWTSPTVYTAATAAGEEEEESPEDTQPPTATVVTTIRETQSEPEPAMDRAAREEERRVQTPESDTKKGYVYLKEYVNATELASYNTKDGADSGSDYLISSTTPESYSRPSTYSSGSPSSTCTYCGEGVGNDAKITIEHLGINCHPACFKCGVCGKPMGDLLYNMFLHGGKVHCEGCYSKAFD